MPDPKPMDQEHYLAVVENVLGIGPLDDHLRAIVLRFHAKPAWPQEAVMYLRQYLGILLGRGEL